MATGFAYESCDREALVSYADEHSTPWSEWSDRNGGVIWEIKTCLYCAKPLRFGVQKQPLKSPAGKPNLLDEAPYHFTLLVSCPCCGWYRWQTYGFYESPIFPIKIGATAVFSKRNLSEADYPLADLRAHLKRHWGDRREITARQAEALVADVFCGILDAEVTYTSNGVYSPDGGIDFVLVQSATGLEYAFQVKRRLTDRPESVEEVRSFLGAVAVSPYSRGYYVTTAPRFTAATEKQIGAHSSRLADRGMRIDLVDGEGLHAFLGAGRTVPGATQELLEHFQDSPASWVQTSALDHYSDVFELWEAPRGPDARTRKLRELLGMSAVPWWQFWRR